MKWATDAEWAGAWTKTLRGGGDGFTHVPEQLTYANEPFRARVLIIPQEWHNTQQIKVNCYRHPIHYSNSMNSMSHSD